jgi:hypothetical protein
MTLHSKGPLSMDDDEKVIGRGYQIGFGHLLASIPIICLAVGISFEWVIVGCAAIIMAQLHEHGGRLHDLCIRLRRSNLLLRDSRLTNSNR